MKREEIKAIFADATDEQLKAVLDLNGADVERVKGKVTALEAELNEKKQAFETLNNDFNTLKDAGASAEEWKGKLEALQKEIKEKEEKAEADRKAKEKADGIASRFEAVVGDKKFNHEAIRADYLRKFGEALENKDFEGKSDADILHALTKDDAAAFEGVTAFRLEGGTNKGIGTEIDDAKARAVMGLPPLK